MSSNYLYVGSYTDDSESGGIYVFKMDRLTGELKLTSVQDMSKNPTFLTVEPKMKYLYAVNELPEEAKISAYAINANDGTLKYLNELQATGAGMCHIMSSKDSKFLIAANYDSGNVISCSTGEDGSLKSLISNYQHEGSSIQKRQQQQHAHAFVFDKENNFAIAVDLGMDKLIIYKFNKNTGALSPKSEVPVEAGEGPRHAVFHPNGEWLYIVTELENNIIQYKYDSTSGSLMFVQKVHMLPEDFLEENIAAEIQITNDGRFVFASNRGYDKIVGYSIDQETGNLFKRTAYPCYGQGSRMFDFDPQNRFIIIANQYTNNIVVCEFNKQTGEILNKCWETSVSKPNFVKVIEI